MQLEIKAGGVDFVVSRAVQDHAREAASQVWTRSDLVLTTRYGDPIEPRNVNRYFAARQLVSGRSLCTTPGAVRRDDGGLRINIVRRCQLLTFC